MRDVLAVILAGDITDAEQLLTLSRVRSQASVPFAGQYRLIDFTLSNCAHSGITNVAVATQHMPTSLKAHIGVGRPWDLDRRDGGVRLLEPFAGAGEQRWYRGSADALIQHADVLDNRRFAHILVAAGAFLYKMDYRPLLDFHRVAGADVTAVVKAFGPDRPRPYGTFHLGRGNAIVGWDPPAPAVTAAASPYASLGIFVFDRRFLASRLAELAGRTRADLLTDVVVPAIATRATYAYLFHEYWTDVATVAEYYAATFECLGPTPPVPLADPNWPIYTNSADDPPVKFGPAAITDNALVADGCIINGTVRDSVLFRRVYVEEGALVEGTIIMDGSRVDRGAVVKGAILDKGVRVGADARVGNALPGETTQPPPNRDYPEHLANGLTVVGKGAFIPAGATVGRNCLVGIGVTADDFATLPAATLADGSTLNRRL